MHLDYIALLHFLFPPSKDERTIEKITPELFCAYQNIRHVNNITTLLPYHLPAVRSAIHLLKFHNHPKAKHLLGTVLANYLQNTLTDTDNATLLVPVPLSSARLRARGYNQVTQLILEARTQGAPVRYEKNILKRVRNTKPQTSLTREERIINLNDAFTATVSTDFLSNKHIILIDDVTTTGATLKAAKAALVPHSPASITCLALAH